MSAFAAGDWIRILSRLNSTLRISSQVERPSAEAAPSSRWNGLPGATESQIQEAEQRLHIQLPPSYRSFLLISNGWRQFDEFIERLLPAQEIARFESVDPQKLARLQRYGQGLNDTDDDYLDYDNEKNIELIRPSYYGKSILVGKAWGAESDMVLLNPQIVFPNGEWETIFFANWIPGNRRYRSFRDFVVSRIESEIEFEEPEPE